MKKAITATISSPEATIYVLFIITVESNPIYCFNVLIYVATK